MANVKQQLNDLSVCSECWIPFDEGEHEPKLLNCPTHPLTTICIECLKKEEGNVYPNDCKTCQNACSSWILEDLPCNVYALQLAQLKKAMSQLQTPSESVNDIELPSVEEGQSFPNHFDYLQCPFIFTLYLKDQELGEVHVMSSPYLIQQKFVQALGEFCFRSPKDFYINKPKLSDCQFYEWECSHPNFHPVESEIMDYDHPSKLALIGPELLVKLDAAIEPTFNAEGKLEKWKFIFGFENFAFWKKSEMIWGSITQGEELLRWLTTRKPKDEAGISFTLETRYAKDIKAPTNF